MREAEYRLSAFVLRLCFFVSTVFPVRANKVVFASARADRLEDNLRFISEEMKRQHPEYEFVYLLETYSYSLRGKLLYLLKMMRASYHLATARLFIIDNAYLPVHVVPHRKETHVIQVWHAASALKRFGLDAITPERAVEDLFVHRNYDYVIVGSDMAVESFASALRTPVSQVLSLGSARTDFFFDEGRMEYARRSLWERYPMFRDRKVVLYAPTFRGVGESKHAFGGLDVGELRRSLPDEYLLVCKTHPVIGQVCAPQGFDVVVDVRTDINELFLVTDVLVTDYSSSVFEYSLLKKPLILFAPDLEEYRESPGFYVDYPGDMIGEPAQDALGIAELITRDSFDISGYDEFIAKHLNRADGGSSRRFVEWASGLR